MVLFFFAFFLSLVQAAPVIGLAINAQVPPVARVGKPLSFQFCSNTFIGRPDTKYTLEHNPGWLVLDGNRTFSGTPGHGDIGIQKFQLVATDATGKTSMEVTFIVTEEPGPGVGVPIGDKLGRESSFVSPDAIMLVPSQGFSLSLDWEIFSNTNQSTTHQAVSGDNAPLPSWIHFNQNPLAFSGVAPSATSATQEPLEFSVKIVASEYKGFSGAVIPFKFIIQQHILAFSKTRLEIKGAAGQAITYDAVKDALTLDGKSIRAEDLKSAYLDPSTWLGINPTNLQISGQIPTDSPSTRNLTLRIEDRYGDKATAPLFVTATAGASIFRDDIDPFEATVGQSFAYQLDSEAIFVTKGLVKARVSNLPSWMHYDTPSLIMSGNPPLSAKGDNILNVTAEQGRLTESKLFNIQVVVGSSSFTPAATFTSGSSAASPTTPGVLNVTTQAGGDSRGKDEYRGKTLIIIIPVVLAGCAIIITFFCLFRYLKVRRKRQRSLFGAGAHNNDSFTTIDSMLAPAPLVVRRSPPQMTQQLTRSSLAGSIQNAIGPLFAFKTSRPGTAKGSQFSIKEEKGENGSSRPFNALRNQKRISNLNIVATNHSQRLSGLGHGGGMLSPGLARNTSLFKRGSFTYGSNGRIASPGLSTHGLLSSDQRHGRSNSWSTTSDSIKHQDFPKPPAMKRTRSHQLLHEIMGQPKVRSTVRSVQPSPRQNNTSRVSRQHSNAYDDDVDAIEFDPRPYKPDSVGFTRSRSGAFRKGQMMQNALSGNSIDMSQNAAMVNSLVNGKHHMGFGMPPKFGRFQSVSTMGRYDDATASEYTDDDVSDEWVDATPDNSPPKQDDPFATPSNSVFLEDGQVFVNQPAAQRSVGNITRDSRHSKSLRAEHAFV